MSDSETDCMFLLLLRKRQLQIENKRRRKFYMQLINENRFIKGEHNLLCNDARAVDNETFFFLFRMNKTRFNDLLERIRLLITKKKNHRYPIPPEQRLALTLRLLAHGESQKYIAVRDRIGQKTANVIFNETCRAIWQVLQPEFLPEPTLEQFQQIADNFWRIWNFPNCVGAIDGKHIHIKAPANSGSLYYNYKGTFSIVLLAVVDANYCFSLVDIGSYGRDSDGGVFVNSEFGRKINQDTLNIPGLKALPGMANLFPHVFIGDEAFPLRHNLMRPFPGHRGERTNLPERKRIFNYRLSRARRISENAFGIMRAKWRKFSRPIESSPDNAVTEVMAGVVLHNYLKKTDSLVAPTSRYVPPHFVDYTAADGTTHPGEWRQLVNNNDAFQDMGQLGSNNYDHVAKNTGEVLADYFMSEVWVPWQETVANRGYLSG